jgi:toxin CptA
VQFPITIGLHRSCFLDASVLLVALLATGATFAFPRSTAIQASIFLVIWLLAGLAWRRLSPTLSAIRLERSGEILIASLAKNEFSLAKLLPGVTVHPRLTVFGLQLESGVTHTVIVAVDSLERSNFRRLRVFLRWQANLSAQDDA